MEAQSPEKVSSMEKLGRYQIREIIGEGAMARVYKAYDPEIDRTLAIKLLKAQLRADDEYRARFLREAKGAGVLSHPNIVTVFDVGDDGRPSLHRDGAGRGPDARRPAEAKQGAVTTQGDRRDRHPARRARSTTRTRRASSTATSSPATSCWSRTRTTVKVADFGICRIDRQRRRRHAADADGQRARHAELHVAGAGAGREGRFALRPLLRRRRALPAADRAPAVRGRLADQRRLQDHQDRAAVARQAAARTCRCRCAASSSARSRSSRTSASRPARSSRRR